MLTELFCVVRHHGLFERVQILEVAESVIGRRETCDVWLPDAYVSREHAVIRLLEDRALIRDLHSRNGTFVNGRQICEEEILNEGDEVQFAAYSLKTSLKIGEAMRQFIGFDESTQSTSRPGKNEKKVGSHAPELTAVERRVFEGFVSGLSDEEVAANLGFSIQTVHTHAKAVYKSFETSTRAELLWRWAVRERAANRDEPVI